MSEAVFLDTSALYAVFDGDDALSASAGEAWRALLASEASLHTSNYVLVELTALLQRRLGTAAVDVFASYVLPHVNVVWVDDGVHARAMSALLGAGRRGVSLVDHTSFVIMRDRGVRTAFAVDEHFAKQGFDLLPQT
jgi:predicted nucleic acid-binding protein